MWHYRGLTGAGEAPGCLGKYSGRLLVLGGARCVWEDYSEAIKEPIKADVMMVNDVGMYAQKPFQHWVSLHPDHMTLWKTLLKNHNQTVNCMTHTQKNHRDHVSWNINNFGLYSGLFAAQVGLGLGYQEIILCGVPMDGTGRFFDPPWYNNVRAGNDATADSTPPRGCVGICLVT